MDDELRALGAPMESDVDARLAAKPQAQADVVSLPPGVDPVDGTVG